MSEKIRQRQYVNVDTLQQQISVSQLAQFYGFPLPDHFHNRGERRMRCPCQGCRGHEDPRSVAINTSDPVKRWKCHRGEPGNAGQYGCGAKGNLVTLAYCMKHGQMPPGGKPTGREFYAIAKDLQAIAGGETESPARREVAATTVKVRSQAKETVENEPNVPLSQSPIETARKLSQLDQQLITDPSEMPPAASAYCRRRLPLLSKDLANECRFGYMPGKAKSTLRAQYVYGVMDEAGEPLAWVGRNVRFEAELEKYQSQGGSEEPAKYRFPKQKLFRRRLELYGQEWIGDERFESSLDEHGLIVCEGFNARLRLHQLGIMGVSIMSNQITTEQIAKLQRLAEGHAGGRVRLMFDLDDAGNEGCKETLWKLHQRGVNASLMWSSCTLGGAFAGRDPESLTEEEWVAIVSDDRGSTL